MTLINGGFPPIKYKYEKKQNIDKQRGFINDTKKINILKLFEVKPIIDINDNKDDELEEVNEI